MSGIDLSGPLTDIGVSIQILFIDLLLSADNALLIALAVRGLPPEQMRSAVVAGTAGAIALRLAMASVVLVLLQVRYLKIAAALVLLGVAVRLAMQRGDAETRAAIAGAADPDAARLRARRDMLGAIGAIIAADAVMSLDNVVAVAAVADGSIALLGFGLALSIPMLVYGSTLIRSVLDRHGALVKAGGMFLGWVAGSIGASDPAVAPWIAASAPALVVAVPLACAIFVVWQARILAPRARAANTDDPDRIGTMLTEGELDAG